MELSQASMQHARGAGSQRAQAVATGRDEGGGCTQLHTRTAACTASHHGVAPHPAHMQGSGAPARQPGAGCLCPVMVPGLCAWPGGSLGSVHGQVAAQSQHARLVCHHAQDQQKLRRDCGVRPCIVDHTAPDYIIPSPCQPKHSCIHLSWSCVPRQSSMQHAVLLMFHGHVPHAAKCRQKAVSAAHTEDLAGHQGRQRPQGEWGQGSRQPQSLATSRTPAACRLLPWSCRGRARWRPLPPCVEG